MTLGSTSAATPAAAAHTEDEELNAPMSQVSSESPLQQHQPVGSGEYHCTGYYVQATSTYAMAFVATFGDGDDDITGGSTISATGRDAFGQFTVVGRRKERHVAFKKQYARYTAEYEGEITTSTAKGEGAKLTGTWSIPEFDAGEFSFILDRVDADVRPVESATWRGQYQQWWGSHDTAFQLNVYASGRLDGNGTDEAGPFTLFGFFVDGSISGPFHFTKQYETHAISYRGERKGDVITGEYESEKVVQDTFSMKRMGNEQ